MTNKARLALLLVLEMAGLQAADAEPRQGRRHRSGSQPELPVPSQTAEQIEEPAPAPLVPFPAQAQPQAIGLPPSASDRPLLAPVSAAPAASRMSSSTTLLIAGGSVLGGAYLLSISLGSISYGAFVEGQWGWFIPIAGPIVVMSGACGNPNGCYFKSLFTYLAGPVTTAAYVAGITLTIVGLATRRRPAAVAGRFQILPHASPESSGLTLLGRF